MQLLKSIRKRPNCWCALGVTRLILLPDGDYPDTIISKAIMLRSIKTSASLLILLLAWDSNASPAIYSQKPPALALSPLRMQRKLFLDGLLDPSRLHDHNEIEDGINRHKRLGKRVRDIVPIARCKLLSRHQIAVVLPTLAGVMALQNFWRTIAFNAIHSHNGLKQPTELFTFTQGQIQATFSCLGQPVSWDFVHDFAMNAVGSVGEGWLDTFDAIYEQEVTSFTVWVSLRVLDSALRPGIPG